MLFTSPGKRPFYKYSSPDTVFAILKNRTVRYSSPLAFNDPFDIQSGLHFDFDVETLHQKVIDRIQELAASHEELNIDPANPWGEIVLTARQYYSSHGFDRKRWFHLTKGPVGALIEQLKDIRLEYKSVWENSLLPGIRVFCVTEDRDNLLMWAHYARDHTGAVFELWSRPEEDNPLSTARPVDYREKPPSFFTEKDFIDELTGVKMLDRKWLYRSYAYVKSEHWKYEKEWRVWYPQANPATLYDDVPLRQSEFRAIYFGCKAEPKFIESALVLIKRNFHNVNVFVAKKSSTAYSLEYEPLHV